MTNLSIETFNGSIQNQPVQLVNAKDLHLLLKVQTRFQDWIKRRIYEYKFAENLDFIDVLKFENVDRGFFGSRQIEIHEYHLTLDMAKELCMLERSEIGRQIRRHFIKGEEQARLEIPRLKQQLMTIPAFLRNNPNEIARLQKQAQQALFAAYPECEKIILYREMGLENREIGKLLDLGKHALEFRLRKLFDLGLLQRRQTVRQLALFA
ncbi:antirepressor [Rodentibacter trehalosifermentans]|uniref:Antirepressor n=1 Tax=Rodentibacter trehalosifermentans TaxID=1908263 RepID=A0A1V3ITY6_9PAST|nr:antA/AntB antirepressor family protein [Rodentibacter trehalosifermentans]OOF45633.1 antirepressor [Rodentibacter trehalosifermentans]